MSVFECCLEKCRARKGAVVYSDGEDRRVVSAAAKLIREGLVEPILIGDPEKVHPHRSESHIIRIRIIIRFLVEGSEGIIETTVCRNSVQTAD